MPDYKVRTGYKLTVADPANPGRTLDKLGGDTVELTPEEAAQFADALEPSHAEQQATQQASDAGEH
jgi:hypothetical protein